MVGNSVYIIALSIYADRINIKETERGRQFFWLIYENVFLILLFAYLMLSLRINLNICKSGERSYD